MKFFCFHPLFILFISSKIVGIASVLECYHCGEYTINCTADEASMNRKNCYQGPVDRFKPVCAVEFLTTNPPKTVRKCGSANTNIAEDDLKCDKTKCLCLTDRCNGFALDTLAKTGRVKKPKSSSSSSSSTYNKMSSLTLYYLVFILCLISIS